MASDDEAILPQRHGLAVPLAGDELEEFYRKRSMLKRNVLPEDIAEGVYFFASDASAILAHTRQVVYLNDGDVAVIEKDRYRVIDIDAQPQRRSVSRIEWDLSEIERGGYDHFMLKEIFEQPVSVENTMRGRLILEDGNAKLGGINLSHEQLLTIDNVIITACGTSCTWHPTRTPSGWAITTTACGPA